MTEIGIFEWYNSNCKDAGKSDLINKKYIVLGRL